MSVHTVCATFNFNSPESKSKFLEILKSPDGLSKTRQCNGCQSIECYESTLNDKQIIIWQKWNKQEDHEAYLEIRKESGMFELLNTLLETPLDVNRLSGVSV